MYRHSQQSFRALFRLCLQRQAAAGELARLSADAAAPRASLPDACSGAKGLEDLPRAVAANEAAWAA